MKVDLLEARLVQTLQRSKVLDMSNIIAELIEAFELLFLENLVHFEISYDLRECMRRNRSTLKTFSSVMKTQNLLGIRKENSKLAYHNIELAILVKIERGSVQNFCLMC